MVEDGGVSSTVAGKTCARPEAIVVDNEQMSGAK